MTLTVPNAPSAAYSAQAQLDSGDLAAILAGIAGTGVILGCAVSAQGTPNMTVAVASGEVENAGLIAPVTAGNLTISVADPVLARFDLVVASSAGALSVVQGTSSLQPVFPAIPSGSAVLAAVYVPAAVTAITSSLIIDKRVNLAATPIFLNVKDPAYGARGDGVTDDTAAIKAAVAALPANGGTVYFPPGTYLVSSTISITAYQRLLGAGTNATTLVSSSATFALIHAGNRQSDGIMRNDMCIEKMTVNHAGGASTNPVIWLDGGGQGTHFQDVLVNQGQYGFLMTDLDRCYFINCRASNQRSAGIRCETGKENTWGTVAYFSCSVAISDNNGIGWQFSTNADQGSPNAFDRVSIFNSLFFMTTGVTGGVGLQIDNPGAVQMALYGCLFEQCITQVKINKFSDITFYSCTFLDANQACVDIFNLNTDNHLIALYSCRLQQATNCFHSVSGFANVGVFGLNSNQGNITNIWQGSFGWRTGTDTQFAGGFNIDSGNSATPFNHVWMAQVDLNESATAPAITNGSTITTYQIGIARVAPTGNVTGIIMQAGQDKGSLMAVRNESNFTVTFAASGTSNVANGTNCVIAAGSIKWFSWSTATNLWYPTM